MDVLHVVKHDRDDTISLKWAAILTSVCQPFGSTVIEHPKSSRMIVLAAGCIVSASCNGPAEQPLVEKEKNNPPISSLVDVKSLGTMLSQTQESGHSLYSFECQPIGDSKKADAVKSERCGEDQRAVLKRIDSSWDSVQLGEMFRAAKGLNHVVHEFESANIKGEFAELNAAQFRSLGGKFIGPAKAFVIVGAEIAAPHLLGHTNPKPTKSPQPIPNVSGNTTAWE